MANAVLVLGVLVGVWYLISFVRRHPRGIVAQRGMSIGADLGWLADQDRVRVRSITKEGADRVRIVLTPDVEGAHDAGLGSSDDLDLVVFLREEDFGFTLLRGWRESETALAIVIPPGSPLVRLRSIDDLQPLTLRRVE